jgi:hypothetical protein
MSPEDGRPWQPIASAPLDRRVELRATYIPSEEAARNGSKRMELYGEGIWLYNAAEGPVFSGSQGHMPHSWREKAV